MVTDQDGVVPQQQGEPTGEIVLHRLYAPGQGGHVPGGLRRRLLFCRRERSRENADAEKQHDQAARKPLKPVFGMGWSCRQAQLGRPQTAEVIAMKGRLQSARLTIIEEMGILGNVG